jgi:DNA-binding response OmpR family regulator
VALAAALDSPPDLALLDVCMPGMDGFELCRHLEADPRTAAVPVIFISAAREEAVALRGFDAGAVDFVSTPFEGRIVLARVATHLRRARTQRDLESERSRPGGGAQPPRNS